MSVTLPTDDLVSKLDSYRPQFNIHIAKQLRVIMDINAKLGVPISSRFSGINESTIAKYAQLSYESERCLHTVAAICWACKAGISSILIGENDFSHYWAGADIELLELMTVCNAMGTDEFSHFGADLIEDSFHDTADKSFFVGRLDEISTHRIESSIAPDIINMEAFREAYYHSIACSLSQFRNAYSFTESGMARALGVSVSRYRTYESLSPAPRCIPMYTAARFKIALNIPSTVNFLTNMPQYSEAGLMREIQQGREELLYDMFVKTSNRELLVDWKSRAEAMLNYSQIKEKSARR